jgi:hypothetical protein
MSEDVNNKKIVKIGESMAPLSELPDGPPTRSNLLEIKLQEDADLSRIRSCARRQEIGHRLQVLRMRLVRDDRLGYPSLEQAKRLHLQLIEQMHLEIAAGATAHERVPRLVRYLPWTVALLDGLILYTFCADIFDAQTGELSRDGLAAMALAVLGSGITYAWLSMTGTRLRDYRAILGEICWRQTGLLTRTLVGIAAVISATLSVLMYERVSEQAQQASGLYVSPAQVPVLGLVFAILSLCANLTVVVVHALDGSSLAAHTRHAGLAIRRSERRLDRVRRIAWRRALRAEVCPDPLDERANTQPRSVIGGP